MADNKTNISGAEAVILSLIEEGVEFMYGYPGGAIMPVYDELYKLLEVEFADVILVSKTDLVEAAELERLTAIIKSLNTEARIIPIANGAVNIDDVLNTGLFNFEKAQLAPGWLKEMPVCHLASVYS